MLLLCEVAVTLKLPKYKELPGSSIRQTLRVSQSLRPGYPRLLHASAGGPKDPEGLERT